jgi:hypothetical protein
MMRHPIAWLTLVCTLGCAGATTRSDSAHQPTTASSTSTDEVRDVGAWLVDALRTGRTQPVLARCDPSLRASLQPEALGELTDALAWLGPPNGFELEGVVPIEGGERRVYTIDYDAGLVELETSTRGDALIGFRFGGGGYQRALDGSAKARYDEFKIYAVEFVDAGGKAHPEGKALGDKVVQWRLVVGGIEELGGEHHLTIEQTCFDRRGEPVFRRPVSFDVRFANHGGATSDVGGHVELPGPGKYELSIVVRDNVALDVTEVRVPVEVVASR